MKTTITEINLEFVNFCNLRCKWCSLDHTLDRNIMKEDLLRKFFDNLISDRRFDVKDLLLFDAGEILLHPNIVGMLSIIKEYKDTFSEMEASFVDKLLNRRPSFPEVGFLTNGIPMNRKLSEKLVSLDVLDLVRFSVDGGTREKYEELRKGAKWSVISRNIADFAAINKGKIKTGIICIIEYGKERTQDWMSDEFKEVCSLVDDVELRYAHDWLGDIVKVEGYKKVFKNTCKFLNHSLVIKPNGSVTVCCVDLNAIGIVGNLYKEDLYQIYDSEKRKHMIHNLRDGRTDENLPCKNCAGY